MSEGKNKKQEFWSAILLFVVAGAAVIFLTLRNGGGNAQTGCKASEVSPFGQASQSVWVELPNAHQASTAAGFEMEYPAWQSDVYKTEKFRAYTDQVMEVWYVDDQGSEGMRFSKTHSCGAKDIYKINVKFRSMNIEDIAGREVSLYGDGEKILFATFEEGEYSYAIQCVTNPQDSSVIEEMVKQFK